MSVDVTKQTSFIGLKSVGLSLTKQSSFASMLSKNLQLTKQTAYIGVFPASAPPLRRRMPLIIN